MDFEKYKELSGKYNLIPVYEIITADMLTPVLAYLKIRQDGAQSFLLESVEGSASMARYSFIGINPEKTFSNKGLSFSTFSDGKTEKSVSDIFNMIKTEISRYKQPRLEELPDFTGGLVGYIGYENIALVEKSVKIKSNGFENPDSCLGIYKNILAFDHYKHQIVLIANTEILKGEDLSVSYKKAKETIGHLKTLLKKPVEYNSNFKLEQDIIHDFEREPFYEAVEKSKKNILEGDIFQIVLSKRFSSEYKGDLLNVYRALRIINPTPYMYFLEFGNGFSVIGTSPEDLVKVKNKVVQTLPIAGTRGRGRTKEEDLALEENLLADPKEIAEHTMLVDLGRNDLGRVCKYGTVRVSEKMKIQRYSHVMHIVTRVEGELAEGKDAVDALKSCFPAGTVTGAPKIRAIQLIDEYEKLSRNVYAGSVGYFDFSGNLDMCIAIRTLFAKSGTIYWQAGAGIVADSVPELEAKEIINKSAAMFNALKYAEVIDENPCY
jgi:anthranilate synthase component 1